MFNKFIKSHFEKGDPRTVKAKKNIISSLCLKLLSIIISLQIVPITINYIDASQYGVWLTLSSIVGWISYFDLGFTNGFRNKFTESKALENISLAKSYVSTTYAVLTILFSIVFIVAQIINGYIDWSNVLNVKINNNELRSVFSILSIFLCINIVASIFTTMLTADQKPAKASFIQTLGQCLAFIIIAILTHSETKGNLTNLAFIYSGVPCILLVLISIVSFYHKDYKDFKPSFSSIDFRLSRNIIGLGGKFFIIMISMLVIFQFINIILSRVIGPEAVTQYNITYKYFNVIHMGIVIILTPFWSAFTDAYTKKDFGWMKKTQKKLELIWLLSIPIYIIMIFFSKSIYVFWIGDKVEIPLSLTIIMSIYSLSQTFGGIYMYLINGTGKVKLQLIIYLLFSFISLPIMYNLCKLYGIESILIIPILIFITQGIIGRIQLKKIINNKAHGIWNK